jgi:hypothetical protein
MAKSEGEAELTPSAIAAIRRQVWYAVLPGGAALAVASAVLGFFVNEVARSSAYADALANYTDQMIETTKAVALPKQIHAGPSRARTSRQRMSKAFKRSRRSLWSR